MFWSAAAEKTRSKLYVLLLRALAPMDSSISLPLTPSVRTTTVLFSLALRWLRPRQRTTTLMLVSSPAPASDSRSRALRLVPAAESAGDAAPARSRRSDDAWRTDEGRTPAGLAPARLDEPAARVAEPMAGRLAGSRSERVEGRGASADAGPVGAWRGGREKEGAGTDARGRRGGGRQFCMNRTPLVERGGRRGGVVWATVCAQARLSLLWLLSTGLGASRRPGNQLSTVAPGPVPETHLT